MKKKGIAIALAVLVIAGGTATGAFFINCSNNYRHALTYVEEGMYEEAAAKFSALGGYRDSSEYTEYCLMKQAAQKQDWMTVGQYAEHIAYFLDTSKYAELSKGNRLYKEGKLNEAIECLQAIEGLSEADSLCEEVKSEYANIWVFTVQNEVNNEEWERAFSDAEDALVLCDDERLKKLRDSSKSVLDKRDYDSAVAEIRRGNYGAAADLLRALEGYEDSQELLRHVEAGEKGWRYLDAVLYSGNDLYELADLFAAAGDYEDAAEKKAEYEEKAHQTDYEQAMLYMDEKSWEEAEDLLETLQGYEDSELQLLVCRNEQKEDVYQQATSRMQQGLYEEAEEIFKTLDEYKDSKVQLQICVTEISEKNYQNAVENYQQGDIDEAYDIFAGLNDYKDSNIYCRWIENEGGAGK